MLMIVHSTQSMCVLLVHWNSLPTTHTTLSNLLAYAIVNSYYIGAAGAGWMNEGTLQSIFDDLVHLGLVAAVPAIVFAQLAKCYGQQRQLTCAKYGVRRPLRS